MLFQTVGASEQCVREQLILKVCLDNHQQQDSVNLYKVKTLSSDHSHRAANTENPMICCTINKL